MESGEVGAMVPGQQHSINGSFADLQVVSICFWSSLGIYRHKFLGISTQMGAIPGASSYGRGCSSAPPSRPFSSPHRRLVLWQPQLTFSAFYRNLKILLEFSSKRERLSANTNPRKYGVSDQPMVLWASTMRHARRLPFFSILPGATPGTVLFTFLLSALAAPLWAQGTYTAASCNYSAVNAVVNGPTHTVVNGDTIVIPAGTCTWTSQLLGPSGVNFQLLGTGSPNIGSGTTGANASCANGTTGTYIIDDYTGSYGMIEMRPSYNASYNAPASRISCMAIDPNSTSTSLWDPILFVGTCTSSGCPAVRVDNITFGLGTPWSEDNNSSNAEAGILAEMVFGVLDHNTLCSSGTPCSSPTGFELFNAELGSYLGTGSYGDNSWAQPDSFGGANNLFAENNLIYNGGYLPLNDCEQDDQFTNRGGCRVVVRYNTFHVTGTAGGFGMYQNHGTDSGGRARGAREGEIYGNTYNCGTTGNCSSLVGGDRSGPVLEFSNTVAFTNGAAGGNWLGIDIYRNSGSWGAPFYYCGGGSTSQSVATYDQVDGTTYYSGTMTTSGSGVLTMTDTSKSWTTNQFTPSGDPYSVYDVTQGFYSEITGNTATTITIDGNIGGGSTAWTGFKDGDSYQVLRTSICADQPARGQGTYISGTTPSPTGYVGDVLDPIYRWADSSSGGSVASTITSSSGKLIAYRDWYDAASGIQTTSSLPFSCNGSTGGTGWGTTANRPSSCTGACSANTLGCGYWATDANEGTGELYVWKSGAWTAYYAPYTYPHPLDGGTAPVGTASPTNPQVTTQ